MLSFGVSLAYTPSSVDGVLIEKVTEKIQDLIDQNGDSAQEKYVMLLEQFKNKTQSERLEYIIDGVLVNFGVVDVDELVLRQQICEKYDCLKVGLFYDGRAIVDKKKKLGWCWGDCWNDPESLFFVDKKGNHIDDMYFGIAKDFSEGVAVVGKNGEMYYVDKDLNPIFDVNFRNAYSFENGYALVELLSDEEQAFLAPWEKKIIDREGIFLDLGGNVDWVWHPSSGLIPIKKWVETYYVDFDGNKSSFQTWNYILPFTTGGKACFVDFEGNIIIDQDLDYVDRFVDGISLVGRDDRYWHIDTSWNPLYEQTYGPKQVWRYSEGLCPVNVENSYHIDLDGNPIYEERFDYVGGFSFWLASASRGSQKFFINTSGQIVFWSIYDSIWFFSDIGIARVKNGNKCFYIDTSEWQK